MRRISERYLGVNIKKCKFLGQGCEGRVYLTEDGYALKIFKNNKKSREEYKILKKVEGSDNFPKIIKYSGNCILREYVGGTKLKEYIREKGMSERLALNLIGLIEEFKRLKFKRLDIRGEHIFVQNDESIKVIDPRKSYIKNVAKPRSLIRTLDKCGVLDDFIKVLITYRPKLAVLWQDAFYK